MFRIGQKVVCVDPHDSWGSHPRFKFPLRDTVYTVRAVFIDPVGDACLRLNEIHNPKDGIERNTGITGEPYFIARRFRPVVEKKTDISVFTEILRRETVDDRAPSRVAD